MVSTCVALLAVSFGLGLAAPQYAHTEQNETVLLESWRRIQDSVKWVKDEAIRRVLPTLLRFNSDLEVSHDCSGALQKLVFALTRLELWAIRMLDAMGKPESGYLTGTTSSLGSYDECLNVVAPGAADFVGQYCTVDFTVPLPPKPDYYTIFKTIDGVQKISVDNPLLEEVKQLIQFAYVVSLRFGVCVPSLCSNEDVGIISQKLANVVGVISHVRNCEIKKPFIFTPFQYFMIILLILLVGVTVGCTVLDAYPELWSCGSGLRDQQLDQLSLGRQVIRVFSINYHVVRLLRPAAERKMRFLHGIKFLTFSWLVVGQSYVQVNYQLVREIYVARSIVRSLPFQPVVNAALSMESLFFLTGLLISYGIGAKCRGRKSFSTIFFISKKLWRILPMTAMGVALSLMLPLTSEGPMWKETLRENTRACTQKWWATLLLVQNFLALDNMCMPHLWYFSADMQLYFFALLFLHLLLWKRSAGIACGVTAVLISCVLSGYITVHLQTSPTRIIANPDHEQNRLTLYSSQYLPHTHLGPYAVGLLLGSFLSNKPVLRIPRWLQYMLWLISIVSNVGVCYGIVFWNRGKIPEPLEAVTYSALSRTAWALGLAWLVLACYSGNGGVVNRFLSWKPFVMLSRLTLPAYLLHLLVIWFFVGRQKTTIMGQQHQGVSLNVSGVASCMFVAFLFHVHFEGPLIQLGKLILMRLNLFRSELSELATEAKDLDVIPTTVPVKDTDKSTAKYVCHL